MELLLLWGVGREHEGAVGVEDAKREARGTGRRLCSSHLAERSLSEACQIADSEITVSQVQQALLQIFRADLLRGFDLQKDGGLPVPDHEVDPSSGHDDIIETYRDFCFSEVLESTLAQRQLQRALRVHLHAVWLQPSLHLDAGSEHGVR